MYYVHLNYYQISSIEALITRSAINVPLKLKTLLIQCLRMCWVDVSVSFCSLSPIGGSSYKTVLSTNDIRLKKIKYFCQFR